MQGKVKYDVVRGYSRYILRCIDLRGNMSYVLMIYGALKPSKPTKIIKYDILPVFFGTFSYTCVEDFETLKKNQLDISFAEADPEL